MPTTSEVSVGIETKEILAVQNENIKVDSNLLESQDLQHQKKKHFNQSPRRKNSTNRTMNNVATNNRRNQGFQRRNSNGNNIETTNKPQSMYKQSNQLKVNMNTNGLSSQQQQDSSKKSQKSYHRTTMFKSHNGNFQYELQTDSTSAPPSLDNEYLTRQQINSPGDTHDVPRKYSKNFLNDIGYKLTSPKQMDEMSLRMALGDNSQYFNHFVSGQFFGNQMMIPQHQQYYQSLPRYQQTQHLQVQRIQQRNPHGNYNKTQYEQDPQSLPCHCPQTSIPQSRNVQYCYQNSPTFSNQNKRDFRYGDKNKSRHYNNGYHNNNNNHHRGFIEKSHSFNEEDTRPTTKTYQILNHVENQAYRSLSPTPPSSSKSSSPGVQEKCLETTDDSESTTSGASSVPGFFHETNLKSPIENISMSAPVLLAPDYAAKNVSYWIDNSSNKLHNGHSVSAEEIHNMSRENHSFKRPISIHANKRIQILKHNQTPYSENGDIFDIHMKHCESSEIQSIPSSLLCQSNFDQLSSDMWQKFLGNQQKASTYQRKIDIWRELHTSLKNLPLFHQLTHPKWGLFMVGSTISGFGSDSSDVDMCFVIKGQVSRHDPRSEAIMTLNNLKTHLTANRAPFTLFSLIHAKVPILRFRDIENQIEVDLNYNNCVGVRNTQLLCHYSQLDWRIRPLALVVKLWASFHNINNARNSTISSYSLVLMVIHFLQSAVKPAILPCLHKIMPEKFNHLHDITTINMVEKCGIAWQSENRQTLGELFLRFLDYYSNFDYAKNAISVRTGGVLPIEECKNVRNSKNDPNHWQTLCIEEPFDLTNTARSAYDAEVFKKINEVFTYSFLRLNDNRKLESVFSNPLFTLEQQVQLKQMNQMKYLTLSNGHAPALMSNEIKS